jgi:hypothetical protein
MVRIHPVVALLGLPLLAACTEDPTDASRRDLPAWQAQASVVRQPVCPSGWTSRGAARGIVLCSREFRRRGKSVTDYIQVVDLLRGARLVNAYQAQALATSTSPSPKFTKRTVRDWWFRYVSDAASFCAVNGGFFERSSELSFPLRVNNAVVTAGGAVWAERPRMTLVLNGAEATMQPYTASKNDLGTVSRALAPGTAIVGYYWHFGKEETGGHTFIAIKDADGNGTTETVIVYSTRDGTPNEVASVLTSQVQVRNIIQFDGGGSAQLECARASMTGDSRAVPHAFVTYAARN